MISRHSVLAIAQAYNSKFSHYVTSRGMRYPQYRIQSRELYDFLYINNFDAWLLNAFDKLPSGTDSLKKFIMQMHTGESLVSATEKWDWHQRQILGQRVLKDLAECLIRARHADPNFELYRDTDKKAVDAMQSALEIDGYIYKNGMLLIPEESVIEEKEEEGLLQQLITQLHFPDIPTLAHHLELSASDYTESHWDNSIANSRKFLEAILAQSAEIYGSIKGDALSRDNLARPVEVRKYLEKKGLLTKKEMETIAQVYGLLSETGGHPYIADRDQARLMRHLALTFSQFVLLRLEGAIK